MEEQEQKQCCYYEEILEYAESCKRNPKAPWEEWECKHLSKGGWFNCRCHPNWLPSVYYRKKQRKTKIGEKDITSPIRNISELQINFYYYLPCVYSSGFYEAYMWKDNNSGREYLKRGLFFRTIEEAQDCTKALLKLLESQNDHF